MTAGTLLIGTLRPRRCSTPLYFPCVSPVSPQTSRCVGGHAMPKEEDKSYGLMLKFYAGAPTTEKPGAPRPAKDWSLSKFDAMSEEQKYQHMKNLEAAQALQGKKK